MLTREQINEKMVQSIVADFFKSEHYQHMVLSDAYYESKNTAIMGRKRVVAFADEIPGGVDDNGVPIKAHTDIYTKDDLTKANHKLPHGFHFELINQVKNLLVGEPVKISWKTDADGKVHHPDIDGNNIEHPVISDEIKQFVDDILFVHNDWGTLNQENVKNNQKYSRAWMRVTIHPKTGMPLILNINSKEIIAFEDEFGELTCVIRVYSLDEYDDKGKKVTNEYAEVYDDSFKDVYKRRNGKGQFEKVETIALLQINTTFGEGEDAVTEAQHVSWGNIPFVKWDYNIEGINSLMPIKPFIDLMDLELSDLGNDIEDWREAIWVLENYNGQSVADFLSDLNEKKVIKVGDGGNARPERNEIPYEARLKLYDVLEKNIYRIGRGINFSDRNNLGNITGVGLKWSYELLEEKANEIEIYGHKALGQLFELLFMYLTIVGITTDNLDVNDLEFKFTRSLLINETDAINNIVKASAFISEQTVIDNLPFIPDTDEELRRLEEEGKGIINEDETDTVTVDAIRRLEREEDEAAVKGTKSETPPSYKQ